MNSIPVKLASAGTLLLCLAACAVGPDYKRPQVDTPAFKEAGDWKASEPGDALTRGKWWQAFGDPVLNELQDKLELGSNTLAVAEAAYRQALAASTVANSSLFPAINATGGASRSRTNSRSGTDTIGNTYSAGLSASWEFDLWGRVRRSAESGRDLAQASQADLESAKLSAHSLLAKDYFSLRVYDSDIALYGRIAAEYERYLKITRNRYDQGVATAADISSAETQLKTVQAQILDLQVQRSQMEHAIAVLLGKAPAGFSIAPAELNTKVPVAPAVLASQLLERRPDVAGAERRLASASAQIGVAKAGYFPLISLTGSAGYQNYGQNSFFSAPNEVWALGSSAVMPLFTAGKVSAQVKSARAAFDSSLATYRQTVLTAFEDVEDALVAARLLGEEAKVQGEALEAARRTSSIEVNQYNAGIASYLNVVSALATQLQAERSAVDLQGRRLSNAVDLYKATGGGFDLKAPALAR